MSSLFRCVFSLGSALLLGAFSLARGATANADFSQPDTTTAADSVVTFNEIMYHPGEGMPAVEWVELFNAMSVDVELSDWQIEGGIEFRFPTNTILAAGGYVVVASDPSALQAATGATNLFGPFAKRLADDGETLRLRNHNHRLLDELTYTDEAPWPVAADGSGASLAKRRPYDASSPAANWRASAQLGGTPGRSNFPETDSTGPVVAALVARTAVGRWQVPDSDALGQSWTLPGFDDSGWAAGTASLGFDTDMGSTNASTVARAYAFDGDVTDVSGHGYDGRNVGAQFSTNVAALVGRGKSIQFDGAASEIQVPDSVNPSGYTLALWVSVDEVRPCSLLVRTDASGPRVDWSHQLRINSDGQFEHYLFDGDLRLVVATNVIQPRVWYHVAGTATNNGPMQIYVNGISSGGSVTIGTLWGGGDQWRFGTDSGHTPYYFHGRLDEAGIWEEVLGDEDIARLASGASPMQLSGYHSLITTDVQSSLLGINGSLFVRLPFNIPAGMAYQSPTLAVRYDDGFVAYLNGVEVARRNAPQTLAWNSTSETKRPAGSGLRAETIDLSAWTGRLSPGPNVLAFQALNATAADSNFLLTAELTATEVAAIVGQADLSLNEIAPAEEPAFYVELLNHGATSLSLTGFSLKSSAGPKFTFASGSLGADGLLALGTNELGFAVQTGDKLFLLGPNLSVLDAVKTSSRLQGRLSSDPSGSWLYPSVPTPGATNQFALHHEIVINEILYHHAPAYVTNTGSITFVPNDEQWIELYNRSSSAVDLSGWRLDDAVEFRFPLNTVLAADGYLVVANHAAALRAQYPAITVLGDFHGKLSHRGATLRLLDAQGNPASAVTYFAGHPWPAYAEGGGSSLELRDPRADTSVPESWAPSIEGPKAPWRHYAYRARAVDPVFSPNRYSFNELRLGLLDAGEALLDNVAVVEFPPAAPSRQVLQNTNFTSGTAKWRLVGNHVHSRVEPSPDEPTNPVLHLIATGPATYLENQLETTLKANGTSVPVVAGRDYEISFDAKWLAGSPQLHAELYYNRVAATIHLERPAHPGTPGRRNSTFLPNAGPTYQALHHSPVVSTAAQNITVALDAADPDGISRATLQYAVNGKAWRSVGMVAAGSETENYTAYTASIPAQAANSVIQFYVEGVDSLGATSTYPAAGTNSRALIKVDAPKLFTEKQTFRTILTPADATLLHAFVNLMSDDLLGCTAIHNEQEVFYDARIRLHGSMFSRPDASRTGLRVEFPADHLFRGSRPAVVVRRGNLVETIGHHILNQAGGLPASYCDVVHLVSHRSDNVGPATLQLANADRTFVDSIYGADNDGTLFKMEGIRIYQTTDNGTPEGYKVPQPVDFMWSYDITNLGDDPEQYRWSMLILNQRARDDYSRLVAMGKAFGLTGTARQPAVGAAIDIDEWARYFALQNLAGIGDIYGVDNPHNISFYARPSDGRVEVLPNDWGFAFGLGTSASIYGRNKVYEILKLPGYRRIYQGHLLDLINSTYQGKKLTRWAQHFTRVTGQNLNDVPSYANARGASVRTQLASKVAFAITSNAGQDIAVSTPTVTLQGRGWIDVHDIGLGSRTNLLPVTWLDDVRWQTTIPLQPGTNRLQLEAYDYRGATVGQAAIQVVTSLSSLPQRDYLRITELMYHPPSPTEAEVAAGITSDEDFEFIELLNTGPTDVSLLGVRFTAGIGFDFTTAAITNLAPAQRVLIVANEAAFALRYGTNRPVAGAFTGHLNNGGELLRLVDAWGNVIQEFTYWANGNWPIAADGGGKSLEILNVNGDYADPINWQASAVPGGTPGQRAILRPVFTRIRVEGTRVRLQFAAAPDQTYTLQWRASLTAGDWQTLAAIPGSGSAHLEEVSDDLPSGGTQRSYRLLTP